MSGFPACSTGQVKDLKDSENTLRIFQTDSLSIRESLKENMRAASDTQCHRPCRGREVLWVVHEVSRGLSKAMFAVSAEELGLATSTLLLLLCHGPGKRGCFSQGRRAAEDLTPSGMT